MQVANVRDLNDITYLRASFCKLVVLRIVGDLFINSGNWLNVPLSHELFNGTDERQNFGCA